MLPRLSPRRHCQLMLFLSGVCMLILVNSLLRTMWSTTGGGSANLQVPAPQPMAPESPRLLRTIARTTPDTGQPLGPGSDLQPPADVPGNPEKLPWYITGGLRRPKPAAVHHATGARIAKLWPEEEPGGDRILNQLMFVPPEEPPNPDADEEPPPPKKLKKILLYNGWTSWPSLHAGRDYFINQKCPVDTCTLTDNKEEAAEADAILYKDFFRHPGIKRPPKQVWILYFLECPYHTQHIKYNDVFNWTATYRRDSDLVAPYERWAYYNPRVKQRPLSEIPNYAANKTRKVAWFVSNCAARNGRLQYAAELGKYIQVDIYGACGAHKCLRATADKCFSLLDRHYKFYLAFENSNCKDYITEKFFVNGLGRNIVPIAMGAQPEDYARVSPAHSFIHVDDFESPKALAAYLHKLDQNDHLYNEYFRWKGTGQFIDTHFYCRLCALLHDNFAPKSYRDINMWWRGQGTCTSGSWRKQGKHKFRAFTDDS